MKVTKSVNITNARLDMVSRRAIKVVADDAKLARWLQFNVTNGVPVDGIKVVRIHGNVTFEVEYVVEEEG